MSAATNGIPAFGEYCGMSNKDKYLLYKQAMSELDRLQSALTALPAEGMKEIRDLLEGLASEDISFIQAQATMIKDQAIKILSLPTQPTFTVDEVVEIIRKSDGMTITLNEFGHAKWVSGKGLARHIRAILTGESTGEGGVK